MSKSTKGYYSLRSFFSYLGQYKWNLSLTITVFTLSNILLVVIPVFIGKLVGALAANPIQGHQAVVYVWILILLSSGHNFTWRIAEFLYRRLVNPLSFQYETVLFKHVIRQPYPYFVSKFTGKISSNISTISQEMRLFMDNLCFDYISQLVGLVAVGVILSAINWQTGLIFVAGVIVMLVVGRYTIRNSNKYEKISTDIQSTKNGKIIDSIANFVNVKSFRRELREIEDIKNEQRRTVESANRSFLWGIVFWGSLSLVVRDLIWPATIAFNVYLFIHHELTIAQLTTLLSTILLFTNNIWTLIWYVSQFNLKLARIEEAHNYLFGKINIIRGEVGHVPKIGQMPTFENNLLIKDLVFAYPDKADVDVLKNINISIAKGEKVGIVGHSGSGKTTLTKLLLGYYEIRPEHLRVDNEPVPARDFAQLISYVPQDTSLFHRSIAENIAYASDKNATRKEVIQAAKLAHADEFVAKLSDGYDTLVGERGVKLSAGQRQRIAIARAILDEKPILILDEATSALDSESEALVQAALETLWENKTVIAIAHRLSTLKHMDRILVMDKGQIIEQGSHKDLLAKKGQYAKLWAHQSGGFLEE